MMGKNPQALAQAFKKCKGKILKIQELGIVPDMAEDDVEALIEKLSMEKVQDGEKLSDHVKGQRWYVENLVKFSALDEQTQLQQEYDDAFAGTASEDEMLHALQALKA